MPPHHNSVQLTFTGAQKFVRRLVWCCVLTLGVLSSASAAGAWHAHGPGGDGRTFTDTWFADASTGWAVNIGGQIYATTDGGAVWSPQESGSTQALTALWGIDANNVWAAGAGGTILRWDGSTWSAQATGVTTGFSGIWGSDANNIWAVGSDKIVKWDGTSWTSQSFGSLIQFNDVAGFDANNVWVVGDDAIVRQWNGSSWVSRSLLSSTDLFAVWAASATDIWVVGDNGLITRWNGSRWVGNSSGTADSLSGVWGTSSNDVWVSGSDGILRHWDGAAWTEVTSGTSAFLAAIHGTDATHVWVGGGSGTILKWDGVNVSTQAVSAAEFVMSSVGGADADHLWAVGPNGVIIAWNGVLWRVQNSGVTLRLYGVWASDAGNAWAVGENGTILKWDGTEWLPQISGTVNTLAAVWGTDANNVWVVGGGGTILKWNGTSWSPQTSGTTNSLNAVWGSDASNIWAVGSSGTILKWGGSGWIAQSSGTTQSLTAVGVVDAAHVWAGGALGTIVNWDGSTWTSQASGTTQALRGIWAADSSNVWASLSNGTILKWDGSAWSNDGGTSSLHMGGIWGTDATHVVAVGQPGLVITNGSVPAPPATPEIAVTGNGLDIASGDVTPDVADGTEFGGLAAGHGSRVRTFNIVNRGGGPLHLTGSAPNYVTVSGSSDFTVSVQPSALVSAAGGSNFFEVSFTASSAGVKTATVSIVSDDPSQNPYTFTVRGAAAVPEDWLPHGGRVDQRNLNGTWFASDSIGWMVGAEGVIYHTTDGGASWNPQVSGTTRTLTAVGGVDATHVWAVGQFGTILRWDGTSWIDQISNTTQSLNRVWASDANNVWAVGGSGTILKWDGTGWAAQTSGSTQFLRSVWGSDANNVWAVGNSGTILKWDGTSWTAQTSGVTALLTGVWGSAATEVWAVGTGGTILNWNGSAWSAQTSGTTQTLNGVWGSDATHIWAVGNSGTILKWDGSAWTTQTSSTTQILRGVSGGDASHAVAVGDFGTILRWDGATWTVRTRDSLSVVTSLWGSDANNIWAMGSGGMLKWNGTAWVAQTTGSAATLNGLWGSDASNLWAVGNTGTILYWNGTAWIAQTSGVTTGLNGVGGSDASNVWAVGSGGTILKWNGSTWNAQSSGTTQRLEAVWVSDASNAWAVGDGGTILKWNGSAWSAQTSGTTTHLYSVWGSDANNVWAVGNSGTILKWDGTSWSEELSFAGNSLYAVWGSDANNVWAVGIVGILKWDGAGWSVQNSNTTQWLYALWGSGPDQVLAGGGAGVILTNGSAPPAQPPTVASISPTSGSTAGGSSVVITGTGFLGATSVTFGGAEATSFIVDSDTQITAVSPAGIAGQGSVVVTTPAGSNAANTLFTYTATGPLAALEAYLKSGNSGAIDFFGFSVAVDGDTAVIGAYQEDSNATTVNGDGSDNSASNSGAAYVFTRSAGVWSQQAYLKASNAEANDQFGYSVAVSGNTAVIGAWAEDSNATTVNGDGSNNSAPLSGAAYVFTRSGTTWSQQAYLKASNSEGSEQFGISVAVSGDTAVIGADVEDSNATTVNGDGSNNSAPLSGAAYVFTRSGTTWTQQAYLKASNSEGSDHFGYSVAVSGDTAVIGAVFEDSQATTVNGDGSDNSADASGAAYVFTRSGTTWSQQAYLKASNSEGSDHFGWSVAVSGDTAVIGARREDSNATTVNGDGSDNSASDSGAAYVFTRSGTTWSQQAYLKANNSEANDQFGISVAVSDDTAVIGAYLEDSNATSVNGDGSDNSASLSGAAYIFTGLSGVGAPEIAVSGNSVDITDGDATPDVADHTDFGSTAVSGGTVVRTFTITNSGVGTLNLTGSAPNYVTLSGSSDFSVTAQPSTPVAVSGGTTTFQVMFAPTSAGAKSATISIANDDTDENPFTFAIQGDGTPFPFTFTSANDVAVTANGYTATGAAPISLGYAPEAGTDLMVVNNMGAAFISGTFSNLAQGQTVTLSHGGTSYDFVVNYYGGTGNDLVLTWKNNRALAWGTNGSGELGTNSTTASTVPVAVHATGVLAGKTVVAVAAGYSHSLALCSDSTVAAWGYNGYGQLGNNSTSGSTVPVAVDATGVLAGKTVVAIAAGHHHSVALCSDGTMAAWGWNYEGELGINSFSPNYSSVPVAVNTTGVLAGKTVVAVSAGNLHNVALCSDGTVVAWGDNAGGQLGNNSTTSSTAPVVVDATGVLAGKTVVAVAAGNQHSLALCSDGTLAAWGNNNSGSLGIGSLFRSTVPVAVNATGVLAGKTAVAVAAGYDYSMAACSDGTVITWGANGDGQLGNNSTTASSVPVVVDATGVLAGKTVVAVTAGSAHSMALCSDGTVAAWGRNSNGHLGNGSTTRSTVPVMVDSSALSAGERFSKLFVGSNSRFSLAVASGPEAPEIAISGNGQDIASGDATPDVADHTDFGSTAVTGGTVVRTFTITNSGTGVLSLTGTAPNYVTLSGSSDFSVTAQPSTPVAVSGGTTTFQVTFNPSSAGLKSATVSIANDDANETPFTFDIQGTGLNSPPTDIALSSSSIAENSGANATIGTLSTTDPDVGDMFAYTLVSGTGGTDNASFSIVGNVLTLTPSADFEAKSSYSVRIQTDDGNGGTYPEAFTISISDVNELPSFTKGADPSLPSGTNTAQTVPGWATAIDDGDSTVTQSLTFNITGNTNPGLFTTPPAIAANGTLTYTPNGTAGTATVSVTLTDDTSINGTAALTTAAQTFTITVAAAPEIAVTGNGQNIASGDATSDVADHTDFGGTAAGGGFVIRTFTITNSGAGALNLTGSAPNYVALSGSADFSVINPPSTPVAGSGGTTTFQVMFAPTSAGVKSATVSITNNDTDEDPFTFAISGTGAEADYVVTTTGGEIVITDAAGHGETLNVNHPTASQISFFASGRYFQVDGGAPALNAATLSLTGVSKVTINGGAGSDLFQFAAFSPLGGFPALEVNGDAGDDRVLFTGDITFASGASADLDLVNDLPVDGFDRVSITSSADLVFTGSGGFTARVGGSIDIAGTITAGSGSITLEGNLDGDSTLAVNSGAGVNITGRVESTSGAVVIKGKGSQDAAAECAGVRIAGSGVTARGMTTTLEGTGGANTLSNSTGVFIGSTVSSFGGDVSVTGSGGSNGTIAPGVRIAGTLTASGTGNVIISGTGHGSLTGSANNGVNLFGGLVSAALGNVTIFGTDGNNVSNSGAVRIDQSTVTAGGTGTIQITGIGGSVSDRDFQLGVLVAFSTISASNGDVTLNGIGGGGGTSSGCAGLFVSLDSSVSGGGSGRVILNGTGGSGSGPENDGISLSVALTNRFVTISGEAGVSVTGQSGAGSNGYGVKMSAPAASSVLITTAATGADVTITADQVSIGDNSLIDAGTGAVGFAPLTPGIAVSVGGATDGFIPSGILELSETELNSITASKVVIGESGTTTGSFTTSPVTLAVAKDLELNTSGQIALPSALNTAGGNLTLNGGSILPSGAGVDAELGAGGLDGSGILTLDIAGLTADTQYQQLRVNGAVDLTGMSLALTGPFVPQLGTAFVIVNNDGNDPIVGTFAGLPEGGAVPFNGKTLSASYVGGDGNDFVLSLVPPPTPEISVSGNGVDITSGDATPDGSDHTDFGSVAAAVGTVTRSFTIANSGTGALDLIGAPNRVTLSGSSDFTVTVQPATPVSSGGGTTTFEVTFDPSGPGVRTAVVGIANNDADENPFTFTVQGTGLNSPPTDISLSSTSIAENAGPNASVGTLGTTDADPGDGFAYSLVSGTGDDDNASFSISGSSLLLTPNADFETRSSYSVRIQTSDGNGGFFAKAFSIAVSNVNELPFFTKGGDQSLPAGSTGARTVSGWATSIDDGDSTVAQSLTFQVSNNNNALFSVQPVIASDGALTFTPNGTTGTATVSVSLTDDNSINGNPALTSGVQTFTIRVVDTVDAGLTLSDTALKIGDTSDVTITFTEAVAGFTLADLSAPGGTLSSPVSADGGTTWSATFTPNADTSAPVNAIVVDLSGVAAISNGFSGSGTATSVNYLIDTLRPTLTIVLDDASLTVGETSLVTFTFSEPVVGFTNADLSVPNGSLGNVTSADGGVHWTATFTPNDGVAVSNKVISADMTGINDVIGNPGVGITESNHFAIDTTAAEITLLGNGVEIVNNDAIPDPADHTDFESAVVGGSGVVRVFTVQNTGTAALNIGTITGGGDFGIGGISLPATVNAGSSTTFTVTFNPSAAGPRVASVTLGNNDLDENPYTFAVAGAGIAPALTLEVSPGSISENGGSATATVIRNTGTTGNLTVNLFSSDPGEATVPATVMIPDGQVSATFAISAVDDSVVDGTRTVTITASASTFADGADTIDVTDDDVASLTLGVSPTSISENAGTATGTVSRNTSTAGNLIVSLLSSDAGEATVPVTVTIPDGQSSATFAVTAVDDFILDGSQSVEITASASGFGEVSKPVEVTDDEVLTLSVNDVSLVEGDSGPTDFTFTVSLSVPAPPGGVSFDIATSNGTATTGDGDYVARSLTGQQIAEGETSLEFTVAVNGDSTIETDETFSVTVSNVNGSAVSKDVGVGIIYNDDLAVAPKITSADTATFTVGTPGSFTVLTTGNPTAAVSAVGALPNGVSLTDNGNGTATLSGTPEPGTEGSHALALSAANGTAPEARQDFTLMVNEAPGLRVTTALDLLDATDGLTSLREAIDYANSLGGSQTIVFSDGSGGTVDFHDPVPETITLGSPLTLSGEIVVEGPGAGRLSLSGGDTTRVCSVSPGAVADLRGLSIIEGNAGMADGGAVQNNGGAVVLTLCTLSGNRADRGGAISNLGSGSIAISRCTLAGNSSRTGGAIHQDGSTGTVTIADSALSGNAALARGGAIHNESGTLTVIQSTLSGNRVEGDADPAGGAVCNETAAVLTLAHCTVAGNSASEAGSGTAKGGGGYNDGILTLDHTIVAGNSVSTGGAGFDVHGALDGSSEHNLIGDGEGLTGIVDGANGNQVGAPSSPIDPQLGLLQDNGGPTWTMALLAGSPAIDAGDPAFDPRGFAPPVDTDQRGFARVTKGRADVTTARVDIGAYELFGAPGFSNASPSVRSGGSPIRLATATGATPPGGIFSGRGVRQGLFDPTELAPGVYGIDYTYTDAYGVSNTATLRVTVESGGRGVLSMPRSVRFPATASGARSRPRSLQLRNLGDAELHIAAARIQGRGARGFRIVGPFAKSIAPGSVAPIRIVFNPKSKGGKKASLLVISDGGTRQTALYGLGRGRVLTPRSPGRVLP